MAERTIKVILNGKEVYGYPGQRIIELCEENGIHIPHLCYNKHLSIYGGCSLCLVEVEGARALMRACSTPISEGMVIKTDTQRVRLARKLALELLLSDHVGDCRPPCRLACPGRGDVQGYVNLAAAGNYKEAYDILMKNIPLPASIGRVCPAPCEKECRRNFVDKQPVSIREIKRFIGDFILNNHKERKIDIPPSNGKSVGIVGGGPAGLSAAYYLRLKGYDVTIYEKEDKLGGMMRYGIPDYRLPQDVLDAEIDYLLKHGIKVEYNTALGKDITLNQLKEKHDAVLLAMGCWSSTPMRVPGEDLPGVWKGIEFLYKVNTGQRPQIGEKVAIIGGGNTAMDAARCAKRLGAKEVMVVYRRTEAEMPAEEIEVKEAKEEGIKFIFLVAPVKIEGKDKVEKIICQRMKLGEPDSSGRRRPIPIEGSEFEIEVDTVIAAIGQRIKLDGIPQEITDGKWMKVDDNYATPIEGVFVAGDQLTGPDIAIRAIGTGHQAAESIDHYLKWGKPKAPFEYDVVRKDLTEEDFKDIPKQPQEHAYHKPAEERLAKPFEEYNMGLTEEQVQKDGSRCLECGCPDLFECKLREYAIEYEVNPLRVYGEHIDRPIEESTFFIRNLDKCILCGSCVRACDEVAQCHAIDFVKRGFETIVHTPYMKPLDESDCISCGQCIMVCPVGALTEKHFPHKPHSIKPEAIKTTCSFCSTGCSLLLNYDPALKKVVRITTDHNDKTSINQGRSCKRGTFMWNYIYKDRLDTPLIRKNGKLTECSFKEAVELIATKINETDKNKFGIYYSPRLTNEEIASLNRFSESLGIKNLNIFEPKDLHNTIKVADAIKDLKADEKHFKESDIYIIINEDISETHPVLWMFIKEKLRNKTAQLIAITDSKTKNNTTKFATKHIQANLDQVASIIKDIKEQLKEAKTTVLYGKGFDNQGESAILTLKQTIEDLNNTKLLPLIKTSNSNGVINNKAFKGADILNLADAIDKGEINALFLVLHTQMPIEIDSKLKDALKKLDLLIVHDITKTELSDTADVVLPAKAWSEKEGTITNIFNITQKVKATPLIQKTDSKDVNELVDHLLNALKG